MQTQKNLQLASSTMSLQPTEERKLQTYQTPANNLSVEMGPVNNVQQHMLTKDEPDMEGKQETQKQHTCKGCDLPCEVDFHISLPVMSLRKSIRRYRGSYKPSQVLSSGVWFLILVWLWGIDKLVLINSDVQINFKWRVADEEGGNVHVGFSIGFFYLGLVGLAVLLWYQVKREIRESFYVAIVCSIAMLVIILRGVPDDLWWLRNFVMIIYSFLMLVVFAYKAFLRNILPMLHKYDSMITRPRIITMDEAEVLDDGGSVHPLLEGHRVLRQTLHYTTASDWWRSYHCCRRVYQIKYEGQVDEKGLPHGFGIWQDNFRYGEHLVGKWHHGRPIGPFKSREWGSGSAFMCRRMAYIQCRGDRLTKFGWYTKLAPLTVGNYSIECSVSGVFYRDYPRISWLYGPVLYDNPQTIALHEEEVSDEETPYDFQRSNSCGEIDMEKFVQILRRYRRDLNNIQPTVSYADDGTESPPRTTQLNKQNTSLQQIVVGGDESSASEITQSDHLRAGQTNGSTSGFIGKLLGHKDQDAQYDASSGSTKNLLDSSQNKKLGLDETNVVPRKSSQLMTGFQHMIMDFFKDPEHTSCDKITWLVPGETSDFMDLMQYNTIRDGGQSITIMADPERGIKISGYVPREHTEFEFLPGASRATSLHIRVFEVNNDQQNGAIRPSYSPLAQTFNSSYQFQVIEEPIDPLFHQRTYSLDMSKGLEQSSNWIDDEQVEEMDVSAPHSPSNKSEQYWLGNVNILRAHSELAGRIDRFTKHLSSYTSLPTQSQNTQQSRLAQNQVEQMDLLPEDSKKEKDDERSRNHNHKSDPSKGDVQIDGWIERSFDVASEALLFFHGYNCSVEHGMKLFGQMISLGNFPAHIRPVVFGWPNSRDWSYYHSQKSCAARNVHLRVLAALRMLAAEGIQHIHIMSHSMGCRLALCVVPILAQALAGDYDDPDQIFNNYPGFSLDYFFKYAKPQLKTLCGDQFVQHSISKPKPRRKFKPLNVTIETFTLMNPEYSLEDFVHLTGPILREKVCPIVTIYGDRMDAALSFSEFLNGIRRWWRKEERRPVATLDYIQNTPGYRTFEGSSGFTRKALDLSVGHHIDYIVDPITGQHLDIDVISTTYLQGNIHVHRHNYFHLNKEVVEDLRDLITTKRRAFQRGSRLEHSHGNVYNFMVAPSHVAAPS